MAYCDEVQAISVVVACIVNDAEFVSDVVVCIITTSDTKSDRSDYGMESMDFGNSNEKKYILQGCNMQFYL